MVNYQTQANSTLNATDTLNGAAGTDNLSITTQGTTQVTDILNGAIISNVETVTVRALSTGGAVGLDANSVAGLKTFNSNLSTTDAAVTNLGTGAVATMTGNGAVTNGALSFGYKAAADAAVLNVVGGTTAGAVAITTAPTAVTINSTGANNVIGTLNVGAAATTLTVNAATGLTTGALTGAALKTINVSGAASTGTVPGAGANEITSAVQLGTLSAAVTTIDASGLTAGGVSATLIAGITSFKGGAGTDTVTTFLTTSQTASIINAGDGTGDVLRVGATTDIDTATKAKVYAGFEVLDTLATTGAIDASLLTNSAIAAVRVGGGATLASLSATQAANVTVYADSSATYGITGAATVGQLDTLKLTIDDGLAAVNTITLANIAAAKVETINFVANDKLTISSLTNSTDWSNIGVTGAGNTSITTGASALIVNSKIDANALTGTLTVNAAAATANGLEVVGSSTKVNTLTGTAQNDKFTGGTAADVLKGLTGNDVISAGDGNDAISGNRGADTLTGGAGNDTFTFRPGDSYSFATAGTAMQSTVLVGALDQSAGAGTFTASITIDGIAVTTAAITIGANAAATKLAIITALKTAIDGNAELASYVTTSVNTATLTVVSAASTPIKVSDATYTAPATTAFTTAPDSTLTVGSTNSTAASGVLSVDTITDLNLGGADTASGVDKINLSGITATALTTVAAGTITGATLDVAVTALFNTGGALNGTTNAVGLYTYGADTYLIGNVGASGSAFGSGTAITSAATLENASDFIIKVTGVSGTLDASDFTFV